MSQRAGNAQQTHGTPFGPRKPPESLPRPPQAGTLDPMTLGRIALILTLAGASYLGLAWAGWVPGGWRLQNLFEPHHQREVRRQEEHAAARLASFRAEKGIESHPVVFLGSSMIERMPLDSLAPTGTTLNRGVAFEAGADLLGRLEVGIPPEPGGIVLYMTSIDHRFGGASPGEIAGLGAKILDRVGQLWPQTPIAVLALLPEVGMDPSRVKALKTANGALETLCGARKLPFIGVSNSPLTLSDGSLDPALSIDGLHLNSTGYDHLWGAILLAGGPVTRALQP